VGKTIEVLNIKADMPTAEEARRRLLDAIRSARARGVPVIKVIHGYGSSGVGGHLRSALRKSLSRRRKEGVVKEVIFGEAWSAFDDRTRACLEQHPSLRTDIDLERSNEGMTIIVM
jgi:hypothetical protein